MADRRTTLRIACATATAFAFAFVALAGPAAPAAADDGVSITTKIDGRPVRDSSDRHPVRLHIDGTAAVHIAIENPSDKTVRVRTVHIEGRAVGLSFYAYDTSVGLEVGPRQRDAISFDLDLRPLKGQATGLMPGSVKLLDADRHEIAREAMVTDVRGSLWSVYGMFGLVIAVLTTVALARSILELAAQRMSLNRWWRGVRFGIPGVGIGLIVVFTLSATRLFAPKSEEWLPIVLISGLVGFVLGYLTPTPDEEEEVIDLDEDDAGESQDEADVARSL